MYITMYIAGQPRTRRYSIAEARSNLPSLVRDAENGRTVRLARRGEPVAVLIGHREFERLAAGRQDFASAYEEFLESFDVEDLDPDELFIDVRDKSTGRGVSF